MIINKTFFQSNIITNGRYEMTSLEKNILYVVLSQLKKGDDGSQMYLVAAKDISDITGETISLNNFKKATEKLISRAIECETTDKNALQVSFISSAEYLTGQGIIEIGLSPKILPFYLDLANNFTALELNIALSLKGIYSKRLYEIMSMYKNFKNPTFKISIQELKKKLEVIDSKTGKDKYESFTVFKRNVLDPSEKEINGNSDIIFSYLPIEGVKYGKGRKPIEKLEFTIKKVNQGKVVSFDPNNKDDLPLFNQLITDYKLRKDQAILVLSNYSRKEINAQLFAIRLAFLDKKVRNIGAYTAKVFNLP